jgi:tetratricopeptide (TPR) repeat protein
MVRRRAGLVETDDEATTRAKIAASVTEHVPDEAERRWIEPALLALLGLDAGAVAPDELFAAWRTFFERLASTAPVVMVFEDFHHADGGLIDFVDHLLEWSRSYPIYVVTLARQELLERRPEWGAGKRSFTSVFLEPLQPEAMHELLAGLVPGLPASAEQAIVTRAEGIPLYAVETIRMLLSEGKLTLDGSVYRPTGDLTSLAVPETLTALIASRLDALMPADRALASDAAVLGQSFTPEGLASVSGLDADELASRLRSLVGREVLTLQTDPRSPERGQYFFVQALIREVAYNALAKRDRKSRHLAAARFFESLETDEIAGGLAGHYLAAYRNSAEGAEADAVAAQARISLMAAGQRAAELGSHVQALTFLEQGLTVTTDPFESARLRELAGQAALNAGRYETAEDLTRRALSAQREFGDRVAIARVTEALARVLIGDYRTPDAITIMEPAVEELADLSGTPEGIGLIGQLARAHFLNDDNRRAIELADRVLEAAEHADLAAVVAATLVTKGTALGAIGRPIEGIGVMSAGRQLAETNGFNLTVLRAINNLGFIDGGRDPRSALASAQVGLALARRLGIRGYVASMLQNVGEFGLRTGDWAAGLSAVEAALTEEWDPADRMWLVVAATQIRALRGEPVADALREIDLLLGDRNDAQAAANVAMTYGIAALASGNMPEVIATGARAEALTSTVEAVLRPRAARAALWMGDVAAAQAHLATSEASGLHGPSIEADRRTIRAGIAALEGRSTEALPLYRESLRAWRELGLRWDEALCGLDMVVLLGPADREVRSIAESTREILVQLGAAPFIARLDVAVAATAGPARRTELATGNVAEAGVANAS